MVDLLLTESVTTNMNDFGLVGASVAVTRSGVGSVATPAPNVGAGFDVQTTGGSDPTVTLYQTSIFGAGIGQSSIVVGTFTVNPTTVGTGSLSVAGYNNQADDISVYLNAGGTSTQDFGNGSGNNIFQNALTFDFEFTAVPEPTSILTALALGGGGLFYRRRRGKISKSKKLIAKA